ncbi:ribbon-helix-helix protein, CopG family [Allostreptomyces psammosilenae]|uniref:Ribbon-helix-helix protein CopG domain-containing protein n=1 Tax=Allostreptomyces psammosilenae TaxID=1892865 RepID=A0A853A352_9ACTN|nr:ribbon-helix-helix protein, CopG family [Allostreptomyces psammosilenae]NYI07900.1 hypothetical protein [Allostreptomyces psammosilenae]
MPLKRITVHVAPEDLAIIKAAAERSGVSASGIMREAIHRAARSRRVWGEPLDAPRFDSGDPAPARRMEIAEEGSGAREKP